LRSPHPRVLIVAPMSGHYATLLRGTVEAFLPTHEVYITDWSDARMVPLTEGRFDLDDYVDYVIEMLQVLGTNMHVIAVCQPSVPVLAAVSVMEAERDPFVPVSMTLMGGPIDTRRNPTAVNNLAAERGIEWFRSHVITKVPFPHPGVMRDVYPGFLQLTGLHQHEFRPPSGRPQGAVQQPGEGRRRPGRQAPRFYDEYLAVMDLTAEYYLQTVDTVFVKHALPKGEMTHRGKPVDPSKITPRGADDGGRRERRHFRARTDRSDASHCAVDSRSSPRALRAKGRRPLRRVQRLALQIGNRARISDFMLSAANTKPSLVAAAE
jgi:poly(3-hydroxybutyrate) depolymerase